jgi:hypothetical protein
MYNRLEAKKASQCILDFFVFFAAYGFMEMSQGLQGAPCKSVGKCVSSKIVPEGELA